MLWRTTYLLIPCGTRSPKATNLWNQHRSALASLISFSTTNAADAVPQSIGGEFFEEATEYGIPRGIGRPDYLKLGFSFKDWDLASKFTWKALRSMSSEQATHAVQRIFEADSTLVNGSILNALFNNVARTNDYGHTVYPVWSGDGMVPPDQLGKTFDGTHSHYLTTNSTVLDAKDIENLINHVRKHGYGTTQSARFIVLVHPDDVTTSSITSWRAGVEYRTGVPLPKFDFISSSIAPAFLTAQHVVGETPPPEYSGLPVLGSYAGAYVIQSYYVPKNYCAVVASAGPGSPDNPVGFREHERPEYYGLRQIPGHWQGYPLIETF
jgi:hypothetical protein